MASTSSQIIPPSSANSTSTPTLYDVFLSFRGTDTRNGFTSHLYNSLSRSGIRTFMDDPDLRSGEVISSALESAIHNSKIYVAVLSRNYASSSWCLDELVEILKCLKEMKRFVIPVFYKIDPSVVRHQTRSFRTAFEKHHIRFGGEMERVKNWRDALHQVANFSGYHVFEDTSEADITNKVVERILLEISPMTLEVTKYPIGLDSRIEDIKSLLNTSSDVTIIGIYGMGGIGKTTLAKAVFNKILPKFDGGSFLADVREVSGTVNGLVCLQQQLLDEVLRKRIFTVNNVSQGTMFIKERICSIKALIVIDDLDSRDQFESLVGPFVSGSVIIVTTRKEDLLVTIEVKPRYRYMLKELDNDESSQLFQQHAFGDKTPSDKLMHMSKEILQHAGGLPLALEVFGSSLHDQPEVEYWRQFVGQLQERANQGILKILMISFDTLVDPMLKEMFLDITCFFVGKSRGEVVRILGSYYRDVDTNIDRLKSRCLITFGENNVLLIHDQLRDMGWEIVRQNYPKDEPEKHSRISGWEDINDVLENNKGTEAIKGMVQHARFPNDEYCRVTFDTETFKSMPKLRFLKIKGLTLTGTFEHAFKDLRWFHWSSCPLESFPSDFCPKKLVVLELPYNNITRWKPTKDLNDLKFLDLSHSDKPITTLDFNRIPCLVTLNLSSCRNLEKIDTSIGSLVNLVSLNLEACKRLRSLPDSVCNLKALEYLNIRRCYSLEALPGEFGNMESLTEIFLCDLAISELPDSVSRLSKLVELELGHNLNLGTLPNICNMSSLKTLSIAHCSEIEQLSNLQLPPNLEALDLQGCSSLEEAKGLGELICIKELNLKGCRSLKRLPNLSNLKQLEKLNLIDCSSLTDIECLEELISIKYLFCDGCKSIRRLPNLSNLKRLEELTLRYCSSLTDIDGLEELISIRYLFCNGCTTIRRLPNLSNLKRLVQLNLMFCSSLTDIEGLEELISIRHLTCDGCTSIRRLPNLSKLKWLEELTLRYCSSLTDIEGLEELISIRYLICDGCTSIRRLPNLSKLKRLVQLILINCRSLTDIEGLKKLISIRHLNCNGCTSIRRLPNLSNLKLLEKLTLIDCSSLRKIEGLEGLSSITELDMRGCDSTMVANTLTLSLYQIYSQFGNVIEIQPGGRGINVWMSYSSQGCAELWTNVSHNFTGLVLSLDCGGQRYHQGDYHRYTYSINGVKSGPCSTKGELVVILPKECSILSRGGYDENTIFHVTASCKQHSSECVSVAVHPLYKLTECHATTISKKQKVI